jgi:hypothetical protein
MIDARIGRLLVASLHQAITDLLPTRLEFYESWLHPRGLRDGRIGVAPLTAVLSFLRLERESYGRIAVRAGEYPAEWMVNDLPAVHRGFITAVPRWLRLRLVMRLARRMVRNTYSESRAVTTWRKGACAVSLSGSIFCEVRDRVPEPLCEFYAAAIRRMMALFDLDADVEIMSCRATGSGQCLLHVTSRAAGTTSV